MFQQMSLMYELARDMLHYLNAISGHLWTDIFRLIIFSNKERPSNEKGLI